MDSCSILLYWFFIFSTSFSFLIKKKKRVEGMVFKNWWYFGVWYLVRNRIKETWRGPQRWSWQFKSQTFSEEFSVWWDKMSSFLIVFCISVKRLPMKIIAWLMHQMSVRVPYLVDRSFHLGAEVCNHVSGNLIRQIPCVLENQICLWNFLHDLEDLHRDYCSFYFSLLSLLPGIVMES